MLNELSSLLKGKFSSEKTQLSDDELHNVEKKLVVCSKDIIKAVLEMINLDVNITKCSLSVVKFHDVPKQLNIYDESVVMIYNGIVGADGGTIIVYAPVNEMARITEIFLHKERGYFRDLSDENISVIKEFSTIVADYYITALNSMSGSKYAISKPSLSTGLYKVRLKIKEHVSINSSDIEQNYFLAFQTDFCIGKNAMNLNTLLLLSTDDVKKLFLAAKADA